MKTQPSILITGPLPPPAGGISIHINRLAERLKNKYLLEFVDESPVKKSSHFNMRSFHILKYWRLVANADLIFIHSGNRLFKAIHILHAKLFKKKMIITLHGYGHKRNILTRYWDSWLYNFADVIILVNELIKQKLSLDEKKTIVRHAFIPPILENEPPLPEDLEKQLEEDREKGMCILCGNASRLDSFQGEDLYGLDMILELMKYLREKKIPAVIYFNVSAMDAGKDRFDAANEWIVQYNLKEHIRLSNQSLSFVKLMERSDIMLRPTITDGDSLSIREAIALNKQVITSDAVERPDNCHLFQNRNQNSLNEKTGRVIDQFFEHQSKDTVIKNVPITEVYDDFYLKLLDDVLNSKIKQ